MTLFEILIQIIKDNEPALKLLSLVAGPFLTGVAFYLSVKSKRELKEQATELGSKREAAEQATRLLSQRDGELKAAVAKNDARTREIERLRENIRQLTEGASELWRLKPPRPFDKYREWFNEPKGARILTIGNLKGGVAKTTLAANLAAYISEERGLPVLMIDLDFQGSLSNMVLSAAGKEEVGSNVNRLFDADANLATIVANEIHLAPKLSRGWIVPASYPLAQLESNLILKWIMEDNNEVDVRYRLAHLLMNPDVRQKYAAIIFDMPPRLALGAINALAASHYFLVPTVLDKLSSEAVGRYLNLMKVLKADMGLGLQLAGIAGMMTRTADPTPAELQILSDLGLTAHIWGKDERFVLENTIPRRVAIANAAGEDLAFTLRNQDGNAIRGLFTPLFEQICDRIKLDAWR